MKDPVIRKILAKDNPKVATVIRKVLEDLGVPKVGTAYADKALNHMFENYNAPRAAYYVIEQEDQILGCAGIAPLENFQGNVCELQKMYFLESARGKGLGTKMMEICLDHARDYGFKKCYLETMPYMKDAQKLYLKTGFRYLSGPMGDTGHYSCSVWMLLDL